MNAVVWLANTLAALGRPLEAGHVVLSRGARADGGRRRTGTFEAVLDGLGSVRASSPGTRRDGSTKVAIIGSGNIGTDLMIKVLRTSSVLEMGAMVGIDPASDGLARASPAGRRHDRDGVEGLLGHAGARRHRHRLRRHVGACAHRATPRRSPGSASSSST